MQKSLYLTFFTFLLCSCYDYDYLLFVIENAGTVCQQKNCQQEDQGNEIGGVLNMHGLWPNYFNGSWPSSCGELARVEYEDGKIDQSVLKELDENWVGLYSSTSHFRNHEWQKHGSCYESAKAIQQYRFLQSEKSLQNQINQQMNDYFSTTMNIKKQLNLESLIFDSSKLGNDGQAYWDYFEFKEMIAKATGVQKFAFSCRDSDPYQKLSVIELCLSKELSFIDCPDALEFHYTCNEGIIAVPTLIAH